MPLAIRIEGPDFELIRPVPDAGPEVILGRDPSCHIVLPDPKRNVSRRHLVMWAQGPQLQIRVISTVAGVTLASRRLGPGESAALNAGEEFQLSEYFISVLAQPAPDAAADDPWAELDSQWASGPETRLEATPLPMPEPDPFSDWELETPDAGLPAPAHAGETATIAGGELAFFFQGLGLHPALAGKLSPQQQAQLGRRVRLLMTGVLDLLAAQTELQQEWGAKTRRPAATRANNPLTANWPLDAKLQYLLGGQAVPEGYEAPDKALADLLDGLQGHERAMLAATRTAMAGVLGEFEPSQLKSRLLGASPGLPFFGNARLWELYTKHYESRGEDLPAWLERLFEKHFLPHYAREVAHHKDPP